MPVRSSVCTYSPSSVNSKYSTALPSPSSLSIGHYKPLSSSTLSNRSSYGTPSIRNTISSSYKPSSLTSSSYSSLGSTATSNNHPNTSAATTGYYRPLNSAHSSFNSRYSGGTNISHPLSTATYSRYSSSSSTSSLSSANSLLDRGDYSTSGYSSSSGYNYQPSTISRRLSYTSSLASSSYSEPLPAEIPKGLVNLGNTCYMNAVIQSLYSVETFRNFILRNSSHDKILTSELSDIFKSMKNSSGSVSPANFKYAFSRYQSKFSGLGQQDSQEFLRYLINGIHEEFNSASKRPRRTNPPKPPTSSIEAWSQYREIVDDSPLVDIVVGQLCSTIICTNCQNKSYCWDPVWDLSLPLIRGRHSCKLSDVIQDFIAKETLDLDERPICSNCKKATRSTKQISMSRLPKLLILHLKKFTNDGYKMTSPEIKIDKVLTFNDNTTYNLKACVSHHGHSSSSGHYTSHCEYSNKWYHFNDDRNMFAKSKSRIWPDTIGAAINPNNRLNGSVGLQRNSTFCFGCLGKSLGIEEKSGCSSTVSDIFIITGGIVTITGSVIAISGIFPRNQIRKSRVRLYLECVGCAMVLVGVLTVLLSLKFRPSEQPNGIDFFNFESSQMTAEMEQERRISWLDQTGGSAIEFVERFALPNRRIGVSSSLRRNNQRFNSRQKVDSLVANVVCRSNSEMCDSLGNDWTPKDENYSIGGDHQAAVEAALSIVLTVATLAGFRPGEADSNQCCLRHAIQLRLKAHKWVKMLKLTRQRGLAEMLTETTLN